jgi:type IV secretory pathway VirB4 component
MRSFKPVRRAARDATPGALLGPDSVEVLPRRVRTGDTWCETFAVMGFPRQVSQGWLQPLMSYPGPLDVAVHVEAFPTELASDRLRRQLARLESSRRMDQQRGRLFDPGLETAVEDVTDLSGRLARGEDKLFRVGLYLTVRADSQEALEREARAVRAVAASLLLDVRPVTFRALEGFITTLPLGVDGLRLRRTFDTTALATTFPFSSSEIESGDGILLGKNASSGSLIFSDRFEHENHNEIILAKSGVGKSYLTKLTVLRSLYRGIEVWVIDPDNEYVRLAEAVGGTVVRLGEGADALNPLDLRDCGGGDALKQAALFCHTLCSTLLQGTNPEERAVLDRAILAAYEARGITADPLTHARPAPLLEDVLAHLGAGSTEKSLVTRLQTFVTGSHAGLFERETTVRPEGHLVVFSLRDLPDEPAELRAAATLTALDATWRRVRSGPRRPRIVIIDEAWILLKEPSAARFVFRLAKSARKYWCGLTTVTQDLADVLSTDLGQAVITNSSSQVLLRQAPQTIKALAEAFQLSKGESSYLQNCDVGTGLYCAGSERAALEVIASDREHLLATSKPEELEALEQGS